MLKLSRVMFKKYLCRGHLYLFVILLLSFFLRFLRLDFVPPSLNWDEVSHGYNAYSILKTGYDEWGEKFPFLFRAYGDYKLPVYIYLTAFFEYLFGLKESVVRYPSALAGVFTVFLTYLVAKEAFKNKTVGILASLLVAIEPWSLFLSRAAFEANLALFFFLAGFYLFLKEKFLASFVFFGISVWTYNSYRVFLPPFLILCLWLKRKEIKNFLNNHLKVILFILIFGIFFIPMFYQLSKKTGISRYEKVAIVDEGAISKIIEERKKLALPYQISRLLVNRYTYFLKKSVNNYLLHFDPAFLFFKGGTNYQFSIPGRGILYVLNLPFFLFGLYLIFRKAKKYKFFLIWIFLAPLPSSITKDTPHVLRFITFLPLPMLISAFGFYTFFVFLRKNLPKIKPNLLLAIYILLLFISLKSFLNSYLTYYRTNFSFSWQYGYKEVVNFLKDVYPDYEKIIITKKYGEPHEFLLFYWPWDPERYQKDKNLIRFYQTGWWWVDRFDKFYFVNDWEIPKNGNNLSFVLESRKEMVDCIFSKCLLITSENNHPNSWKRVKTFYFLDGKIAFEAYEN